MAKNRIKQRNNRKKKQTEERLSKYSQFGYKDLTPYNAVNHMINKNADVALK